MIRTSFPAERVMQIAHSLSDPTVSDDTIRRRARSVSNVVVSLHDDFIEANAKFRSGAGLECYVERINDGACCQWCTNIAGKYLMREQPEGFWSRHDHCGCMIIYDGKVLRGQLGANGRRGRRWVEEPPKVEYTPPKRFSHDEAQKLQADNAPKRLTYDEKRGIMLSTGKFYKAGDDPMFDVFGSAEESNPKELEDLKHQMAEIGVNIVYHEDGGTLAYQGVRLGEPGTISATKTASYSAWLHECQHAFDDKEAGWNSCYAAWDADEHIRREMRAYQKEIDLANSLGRNDIADKLISLRDKEISDIKKRDEMYAEIFKNDSND